MKSLAKFLSIFYFLLLFSSNLNAGELHLMPITIVELSASGLSFVAAQGELDNIPNNAKGYFISKSDQKLIYIASCKLMEIGADSSYWYMDQIVNSSDIKAGSTIYFVDQEELWAGRAVIKGNHTESFSKDPKTVIKKIQMDGSDFYASDYENFKTEVPKSNTLETKKTKEYQKSSDGEIFGASDQKGALKAEPVSNPRMPKLREETKDLVTKATLLHILEQNNNEELQEEMKVEIRMSQDQLSDNTLATMVTEKKKERFLDQNAINKIKRDGGFWSADMSDQQLRRFFVTSGILQERERRNYALNHSAGHEISFALQSGVSDNTTDQDVRNRVRPLGFMLGYEYQLGRTIDSFKHLSSSFFWQAMSGSYTDGNVNLKSNESNFGISLNYYLFDTPDVIGKYVPYFGAGVKRGIAKLSSDSYADNIKYSLDLSYVYKVGLKYRFNAHDEYKKYLKIGGGICLEMLYEQVKLGFSDSETFGAPASIEDTNISFLIGGNIYF